MGVICKYFPDSKVHGANLGPTWVLSAPDGPHVGPMNLAIRVVRKLTASQRHRTSSNSPLTVPQSPGLCCVSVTELRRRPFILSCVCVLLFPCGLCGRRHDTRSCQNRVLLCIPCFRLSTSPVQDSWWSPLSHLRHCYTQWCFGIVFWPMKFQLM